ncbi:MAG: AMP-binding protein [Planctomycetaceae bacterium]
MVAPAKLSQLERQNALWLEHYPAHVPLQLDYPREPLGWLLEQAASRFPNRIACHYYGQQVTYAQLSAQARGLASRLIQAGLQPGDRVAVLLPNVPEHIAALFGIWLAGGVVVALSPLMVADQVASLVRATGCRTAIVLDVLLPLLARCGAEPGRVLVTTLQDRIPWATRVGYAWLRWRRNGWGRADRNLAELREIGGGADVVLRRLQVDVNEPAYILPTGGTTGDPKAVVLAHRNLMANAWQLAHWSPGEAGADVGLSVLPFFHAYGLSSCVMCGIARGATLVLDHRFHPDATVELIERHRATVFFAVPTMLSVLNSQILRKRPRDLRSLKWCISGGAPLPRNVADEFSEHTGCTVVEGYGLSEASPVTHAGPLDGTAVPGTIGLPLPDTFARVVDAATGRATLPPDTLGELVVRGPQVMTGYWNNPAESSRVLRDGWLHTGDLATCDDHGFFRIVDRQKDLIITSGFNVYPSDVETVLRGFPGVRDVAVVGQPDDEAGELVKAIVVVKPRTAFNRSDFDEFARLHLAVHQRPKIVETQTADLPRNFLGKVLRRELRSV